MLHNECIAFVREKKNGSSYVCDVTEQNDKENYRTLQRFMRSRQMLLKKKDLFCKKYICHIPRGKLFPMLYSVEKVKYSRAAIARAYLEP